MAPVRRSQKNCRKRTILFAATALFAASVLAQTGSALSNQDTTKPAATLARAEINVEEKGDEFLIRAQSEVEADGAAIWSTLVRSPEREAAMRRLCEPTEPPIGRPPPNEFGASSRRSN